MVAIAVNEDTLEAWYSARPESARPSATITNPSRRFASTCFLSESITSAPAGTRATRKTRRPSGPTAVSSAVVTRCPRPWVVPSTTAMSFTPPARIISCGSRMIAPKNSGPTNAITQNHFWRTRSMNSRRTTAQTLCMGRLGTHVGVRRVGAHQIDEDLVQGRLGKLEAGQTGAGGDQRLEDLLGVGARRELQLGVLARDVRLGRQAAVGEDAVGIAAGTVEIHEHVVAAARALHLGECAVDELLTASDDAHVVAQLLSLLHDVRGEQDGLAPAPQLEHGVLEDLGIDGVEPRERFVHHQQVGVVEDRGDALHLLLHAPRPLIHLPLCPLAQTQPFEPLRRLGTRRAPVHTLH